MAQLYPEWQWEAHYIDGTILYQDDNKLKDICFEKLASFHMVHIRDEKDPFVLMWRPHLKLIHFYRHQIALTPEGEVRIIMYCFGYEEFGKKYITVIMPDGIILTDDVDRIKVSI